MAQNPTPIAPQGGLSRLNRYLGEETPTGLPDTQTGVPRTVETVSGLKRLDSMLNVTTAPSVSEQAGAALESGARSAAQNVGFMSGARYGAMVPGPLPVKVITALTGGALGYLAGNAGVDIFESVTDIPVRAPESFPEELRPAARAGDVIGGSMAGAGSIVAMAKGGVRASADTKVGRFLNKILENAATRPGMFLTAEGTAAASDATAQALSEYYLPENDLVRVAAGIGAGISNPAAHGIVGAYKLTDKAKEFFANTPAIKDTVAGTPEDLANAARARYNNTKSFLNGLLAHAEAQAVDLVGKMQTVDDKTVMAAEYHINRLVDDSYKVARRVENALANRVPQDIKLTPINTLQVFEEVLKERLMGYPKMPVDIESFLRMTDAELKESLKNIPEETVGFIGALRQLKPSRGFKVASSGDLIKLRMRALHLATTLKNSGIDKYHEAKSIGKIAEAALNDLTQLPAADLSALKEYTRYAHTLNETFSRPFVETITRKGIANELRVPPEFIGSELIRRGNIQSANHYKDLRRAIGFSIETPASVKDVPGVLNKVDIDKQWDELMQAQESIIRHAAASTISVTPGARFGKVDPAALAEFRRQNGSLLAEFPELANTLKNATHAQFVFDNMNKQVNKIAEQKNIISDITNSDDPVMAIAASITSKNYKQNFKTLADMVKNHGGDAPEGLFSTAIQVALMGATDRKTGAVSVKLLREALDGRTGMLVEMQKNGIIDNNRVNAIRRFLDKMQKDEIRRRSMITSNAGLITDFVNRLSGIHAAARVADMVGLHSSGRLAVAGLGSRIGQKVLGGVPDALTGDMFAAVLKSPEQMDNIIRETQNPRDRIKQFAMLRAYLWQNGLSVLAQQTGAIQPPAPIQPEQPMTLGAEGQMVLPGLPGR